MMQKLILKFIREVGKISEVKNAVNKGPENYPLNNWINKFDTFDDIIKTLEVQLALTKNLKERILIHNLKSELEDNIFIWFLHCITKKMINMNQ